VKVTRRKLLSAGAAAVGTAVTIPGVLADVPQAGSTATVNGPAAGVAGKPVPVRIHIDGGEPVHWMKGGIGASIHAVAAELPRNPVTGDSWAGSEWGGNPGPDDVQRWEELFRHAEWLSMNWCRVEFQQASYEPGKRVFDWDSAEMQALCRILDWAQWRNVDVFLQQIWANVAWNAYPGNADDPVKRLRSAPYSLEEWAYGLGEIVEHQLRNKGYSCIRWVCVQRARLGQLLLVAGLGDESSAVYPGPEGGTRRIRPARINRADFRARLDRSPGTGPGEGGLRCVCRCVRFPFLQCRFRRNAVRWLHARGS
jgi:hypothetical protein